MFLFPYNFVYSKLATTFLLIGLCQLPFFALSQHVSVVLPSADKRTYLRSDQPSSLVDEDANKLVVLDDPKGMGNLTEGDIPINHKFASIDVYSVAFWTYVTITIDDRPDQFSYTAHIFGLGVGVIMGKGNCAFPGSWGNLTLKKIKAHQDGRFFGMNYVSGVVGGTQAIFNTDDGHGIHCYFAQGGAGAGVALTSTDGVWRD